MLSLCDGPRSNDLADLFVLHDEGDGDSLEAESQEIVRSAEIVCVTIRSSGRLRHRERLLRIAPLQDGAAWAEVELVTIRGSGEGVYIRRSASVADAQHTL